MDLALLPWKFLLAVAGAGWLLWSRGRNTGNWVGLGLAAFAMAAYLGFGNPVSSNLHIHEWTHYYLGAKYAPELGYNRLYDCLVVADEQDGRASFGERRRVTDLRSNRIVDTGEVLADPGRCTDHFTPARWSDFRADVAYLRGRLPAQRWNVILIDHGYNATPVWTLVGAMLANTGPASNRQLYLLSLLDPLLLAVSLAAIWWAFGRRTLAVAVLSLATFLPAEYIWTGRALLRWDWLFLMVLAVCLLKKGMAFPAGLALGYAALLRVFPAALFAGPALVIAQHLLRGCRVDRAWWAFPLGGLASAAALVPFSLLVLGAEIHQEFLENLIKTAGTPFTNAIGLPSVLSWRPGTALAEMFDPTAIDPIGAWTAVHRQAAVDLVAVRVLVIATFAALLILAVRRAQLWVAATLGTALIPAAVDLLGYYYMLILVTALLHHRSERIALWLLGLSAASQFINLALAPGMPTTQDQQYVLISAATVLAFGAVLLTAHCIALVGPSPGTDGREWHR
jgi:hypothetical protein